MKAETANMIQPLKFGSEKNNAEEGRYTHSSNPSQVYTKFMSENTQKKGISTHFVAMDITMRTPPGL